MKWLRYTVLLISVPLTVLLVIGAQYYYKGFYRSAAIGANKLPPGNHATSLRIEQQAHTLKKYISDKKYNPRFVFLVDMSLPSGKNRFFVYDLSADSIIMASVVAHGSGNSSFAGSPIFSNIKGSGCTSLGKYRIGNSYPGRFGLAYKLYGLDSTNSYAFERNIVLHAYNGVPGRETYPYPICNSLGCPMVAPGFFKQLQPMIDEAKKPILLWIFI